MCSNHTSPFEGCRTVCQCVVCSVSVPVCQCVGMGSEGAHTFPFLYGAQTDLKTSSEVRSLHTPCTLALSIPSIVLNTKARTRDPRLHRRRAGPPPRGRGGGGGGSGDARGTALHRCFGQTFEGEKGRMEPASRMNHPFHISGHSESGVGASGVGGARRTSGGGACSSGGSSVTGSAMLRSRRGAGVLEM